MTERLAIRSREEWLAERMNAVTGSDVAPVMGLDPDRSPAKVWGEKTGLISPQPQTDFLEFRLALEAAGIDLLKFRRPTWHIKRAKEMIPGSMGIYLRDPEARIGATPDAFAEAPEREGLGVIEVKTVLGTVFERDWQERDGDLCEAPLKHQLQCLTNMMLAGATWGAVAALILETAGTGTLRLCPVERNEAAERSIREGVARFWAAADAGQMPLPIHYDQDSDLIAALYPEARIKEPPLDLSQDNRLPELLKQRQLLKAGVKEHEAAIDAIESEIKEKLGFHEAARLPGWKISWKMQTRPEHIVREWKGRVLRVTESKQ